VFRKSKDAFTTYNTLKQSIELPYYLHISPQETPSKAVVSALNLKNILKVENAKEITPRKSINDVYL
jgi:hypothetical protein